MPFNEISRGGPEDISARSGESKSQIEHQREQTEQRRQDALNYLMETGRAETPEEAERYLESLNHLKERVIAVLRETTPPARTLDQDLSLFTTGSEGSKSLSERADAVLRPEELDRSDPRVWIAQCTVAPAVMGSMISFEDALLLPTSGNRKVGIRSGGWLGRVAERLYENLSPEERDLLCQEYALTRKELVENLRETAKQWEKNIVGHEWEPLFGIRPEDEEPEDVAK